MQLRCLNYLTAAWRIALQFFQIFLREGNDLLLVVRKNWDQVFEKSKYKVIKLTFWLFGREDKIDKLKYLGSNIDINIYVYINNILKITRHYSPLHRAYRPNHLALIFQKKTII